MKNYNYPSISTRIAAVLLLFCFALGLAACGGGGSGGSPDTLPAASDTADSVPDAGAAETRTPLKAPVKDFGGYEYRILEYKQTETGHRQFLDFGWSSDRAGDLINDAVYQRNSVVEERLNIEVKCVEVANVNSNARTAILAGSDEFDMAMDYINLALAMAQQGMLIDLYDVDIISLSEDWWDQAAIRDLAVGGRMYCATGDITMADEELNYCIFANKTVWNEYDVGDLYGIARDGKWCLDIMYNAAKDVTRDLNGDGVLDEHDVYGILTSVSVSNLWFFSAGGRAAELDADGIPVLVLNTPKNIERIEALHKLFNDTEVLLECTRCSNTWKTFNEMLMEDRALFRAGSVYNIQQYRGMVNDFGILPYPKLDEAQENYQHLIATNNFCASVTLPVTTKDLDLNGIILEYLAYESKETITKAYYDINLYTKVSRDEDSGDMFDIIFATKLYDIGKVFNWGGLEAIINQSIGSGDFASRYSAAESRMLSELEASYEYFAGLE
ncbi:MAG: hypothetical protein GX628_04445 [Clostridiales bacterium]|nr:hypothetical protein [Clostridiales bacterium]